MLLDEFLPRYDVRERHAVVVRATPEHVWSALRDADLGESRIVRLLFALRGLPARTAARGAVMERPAGTPPRRAPLGLSIARATDFGFSILGEDPPCELVLGLEGRFWAAGGDRRTPSVTDFRGPLTPGTARAAWNFALEPLGDGRTRLSTETRVLTADAASRRRMKAYWIVIRPGSGLIRRVILTAVRRVAEQAT